MGKDNQILLVMVNERGFLSLAVSSASKASVLRTPGVGGYGSRFTDRFPRSRSALLLAPIFPRLSHPKQSLSVFCVHRLRYADTVSRARLLQMAKAWRDLAEKLEARQNNPAAKPAPPGVRGTKLG